MIPLVAADGTRRTEDDVLAGMNQLWRRNIRKADKAGVVVSPGAAEDLKAFHDLYVHTAERDHFTPRPLAYFQTMYDALGAEDPGRITLWLAHHEGDLVAATIAVRVGTHAWYSYGASSTDKRDVRGSNAVQWAMIRDAIAQGADVYDLRGITDTLDPDDPHVGLIQFKTGTGGEAVETVGEWDLPLNRALYKGFELYLNRRSLLSRRRVTRMSLTLTVDGERWRRHLREVADQTPGLVPVVKGNGYGFTVGRLARRPSGWAATPSRSGSTTSCPRSHSASTAT